MRAVMARGTTTHAAETLGLTQSTVSRLITQLEEELGLSLFDRRGGRLVVTPEGRQFFSVAEKVLISIDQINATARDIRTLGTGALRIVALPALAIGLLSNTITEMNFEFKRIKISVDMEDRQTLEEGTASGKYDLGIATLPIEQDGIESELLCSENAVCIFPAGHVFEQKDIITAKDMEGMPFISINPDALLRYRIDEAFGQAKIRRSLGLEVSSTTMICNLVATGAGVSIVHPFVADAFGERLISRPFEPAIRIDFGLLYPAGQTKSQVTRTFVKMLKQKLSQS
jgi:DNA-binding transcriptional LysR family regulator